MGAVQATRKGAFLGGTRSASFLGCRDRWQIEGLNPEHAMLEVSHLGSKSDRGERPNPTLACHFQE